MHMFTAAAASGDGPASRMDIKTARTLQWRTYEKRGPGMFVVVSKPYGHKGYQLSAERRRTTLASKVKCVQCADASEVLAAIERLAQRIANNPPPMLRVTVADNLDSGVACRCALLLLAAMQQSEDEQLEAA